MDTKEKEISYHRISKEDEQMIYNMIDGMLETNPGDNAQTRKEKERKRKDLEAFKLKITPHQNDKPRNAGPKRLCYENLSELLSITGLSYLDLLKCVSKDTEGGYVEPQWSSEVETAMCSCCDILSRQQRKAVLALIQRILPDVFENSEFESMTPILRLSKANSIRTYCSAEMRRQTKELGVYDIYRRRYTPFSFNAVELNMISFMSKSFDVSPHWLLGLDESQTVLAMNGDTERIMDLFCFLPEERKQMILQAVQTAVEKGGAA